MLGTATLTIEGIAYYTEGDNPNEARERAKQDAAKAILAEIYAEIRPCVKELLGELSEAPESNRRNRCLVLARSIANIVTHKATL